MTPPLTVIQATGTPSLPFSLFSFFFFSPTSFEEGKRRESENNKKEEGGLGSLPWGRVAWGTKEKTKTEKEKGRGAWFILPLPFLFFFVFLSLFTPLQRPSPRRTIQAGRSDEKGEKKIYGVDGRESLKEKDSSFLFFFFFFLSHTHTPHLFLTFPGNPGSGSDIFLACKKKDR
jgi:hypothetical protein